MSRGWPWTEDYVENFIIVFNVQKGGSDLPMVSKEVFVRTARRILRTVGFLEEPSV
jgi:hypothetical protein